MKRVCFYYRINSSKIEEPERFKKQLKLAVKRIGKKQGEVEFEIGHNHNDFLTGTMTVRISYFQEL